MKLMNQKTRNDFVKKYVEELKIREAKEQQLLESDEYILWLQNFTEKYDQFFNDSWLYKPKKISPEDLKKVEDLELLYCAIQRYAELNYINSTPCEFGDYYSIKFNGIGYNIGVMVGQGICNYCKRVEIDDKDKFINFEDVQKGKVCDQAIIISEKLEELTKYIKKLVDEDVPINVIKKRVLSISEEENHS